MPRYFFHVASDESFPDLQGTELGNIEEVALEAARFALSLYRDVQGKHWKAGEWTLRVTDSDGLEVLVITFWPSAEPESDVI